MLIINFYFRDSFDYCQGIVNEVSQDVKEFLKISLKYRIFPEVGKKYTRSMKMKGLTEILSFITWKITEFRMSNFGLTTNKGRNLGRMNIMLNMVRNLGI